MMESQQIRLLEQLTTRVDAIHTALSSESGEGGKLALSSYEVGRQCVRLCVRVCAFAFACAGRRVRVNMCVCACVCSPPYPFI
jgi:hypothetical protein